jgi:hypothetical protein
MRTFIPIAFFTILFSSCQTYQYMTVASDNTEHNENNEFVAETDTLRITYNFNGKNGPVNIHIYNKSSTALEVDWKRSSLIIGEKPLSFYNPDLQINGSIARSIVQPRGSGASLDATVHAQEGVEFLPPHASITRSGLYITKRLLDTRSLATSKEVIRGTMSKVNLYSASFSKNNSPMLFRCYLSFVVPASGEAIFATEHSFYVIELKEGVAQPQYVIPERNKAGDKFFVSGLPTRY